MANPQHVEWAVDTGKWSEFRAQYPTEVPDLRDANLEEAPLWGDFTGALFDGAWLKGASLPAQLDGASFVRAHLRRAHMQGQREYREEFQRRGAIFRAAHMTGAFLMDGDYTRADFSNADLRGARFDGALLTKANFSGANLQDTSFAEANVSEAVFSAARFKNTDFSKAVCSNTIFDAVDLSLATGLESIGHHSPSSVNIATMFRSNGRIPAEFLAAAHPEIPAEQLRELSNALRSMRSGYHSCFISYARRNVDFVEKLKKFFEAEQIPYWLDSQSLLPGEEFDQEIIKAIGRADRLVVVLSAAAVESSWVRRELEIATATDRKPEDGKQDDRVDRADIVPIRLDDAVFQRTDTPWSVLATREIGDFSHWQRTSQLNKALGKLAKALRRGDGGGDIQRAESSAPG